MKTAIIVHGAPSREEYFDGNVPSASNHHWLPWLQRQLQVNGYAAHTPEIPDCWDPQYNVWRREFERFDINNQSLLVGHSCGGGFLVRWLSENPGTIVNKVVLVAPWLDPWRVRTTDFFNFKIAEDLVSRTRHGIVIFNSDTDIPDVKESAYHLRDTIRNSEFREFHNYGHFCLNDLHGQAFPDLLHVLLN